MIPRDLAPVLQERANQYPVVTLTGPRQSGKTTLCRALFPDKLYINLEDPDQRRLAIEDPRGLLKMAAGGAILDEIQRAPELPSYLQGMVDDDPTPGRFILTGSQQFELMRHVTQSLAGRTAVLRLLPFSLAELARLGPLPDAAAAIHSGFLPRIHDRRLDPPVALADYFATYVERDLRELSAVHELQRFERFVRLCAGRVGQILNLSGLASDAGISHATARAWFDLLQTSHIVFPLAPWFTNTNKRLVKSPKLYFHDVGLAAWLLGIRTPEQVARDPLFGALFENLVVADVLKRQFNRGEPGEMYFFRDAAGHEVDLLLPVGRQCHAIEIKAGATVNADYFRGLKSFARLFPDAVAGGKVIYGGEPGQPRSDWPVMPWRDLARTEGLNALP
ncbi:MAG: ATP-binding protein [Betaproteobacteria bacterium]|nr:ATP-binding protein [Betaproteobacteria bacterium]